MAFIQGIELSEDEEQTAYDMGLEDYIYEEEDED